jgi:hypothetical protein
MKIISHTQKQIDMSKCARARTHIHTHPQDLEKIKGTESVKTVVLYSQS